MLSRRVIATNTAGDVRQNATYHRSTVDMHTHRLRKQADSKNESRKASAEITFKTSVPSNTISMIFGIIFYIWVYYIMAHKLKKLERDCPVVSSVSCALKVAGLNPTLQPPRTDLGQVLHSVWGRNFQGLPFPGAGTPRGRHSQGAPLCSVAEQFASRVSIFRNLNTYAERHENGKYMSCLQQKLD